MQGGASGIGARGGEGAGLSAASLRDACPVNVGLERQAVVAIGES
jgi:hypothetical protein